MSNKYIYPFWTTGKQSETLPKARTYRKKGSLKVRTLQSIKRDKETGEYKSK